eukprot:SAG31_NODE_1322_length_8786_cov_2.268576_6_plen_139_part_00
MSCGGSDHFLFCFRICFCFFCCPGRPGSVRPKTRCSSYDCFGNAEVCRFGKQLCGTVVHCDWQEPQPGEFGFLVDASEPGVRLRETRPGFSLLLLYYLPVSSAGHRKENSIIRLRERGQAPAYYYILSSCVQRWTQGR